MIRYVTATILLLVATLTVLPRNAAAHPGHGQHDAASWLHTLADHPLLVLAGLAAAVLAALVARRALRP